MKPTQSKSRVFLPLTWAMVALGTLSLTGGVRADFEVKVFEDSDVAKVFTSATGTITITGTDATSFPDFTLAGLTINSNSGASPTPISANLNISAGKISPTAGGHTLTIIASDNGFNFPPGVAKLLESSSGFTAAFTSVNDSYKFQSFAASGTTLFDMSQTKSPGHTFNLAGTSGQFNEAGTAFTAGTPFTLTFQATYTASTSSFQPNLTNLQPTGSATVVPEPASAAILGLGLLGCAGAALRRRRAGA